MHRTRTTAVFTLALLNVFTLGAGAVAAHMLPSRLAALRIPSTASRPLIGAAPVLSAAETPATLASAGLPTAAALGTMLGAALPQADTGPGVGIEVADAQTGQVLYADNADALATPASTTKLMTAMTALAVLGPDARFDTTVRQENGTIVLQAKEQQDKVQFSVRDSGRGIEAERLPDLFGRFNAAHDQGTGLGLALVRRLVELLGGQVSVESRLGHGATFTFTLPVATTVATRHPIEIG